MSVGAPLAATAQRRPVAIGALAIISLLSTTDCSRKVIAIAGSPSGTSRTRPDASVAPVAEALDAGPQLDAGPARVVSLVLGVEPTEQPGAWAVMARVPDLALNFRVTSFAEPALCGIVPYHARGGVEIQSNLYDVEQPGSIRVTCTANERGISLWVKDGQLLVGEEKFPLPPNTRVEFPLQIQQAAPQECANAAEPTVIDVKMERKPRRGARREESTHDLVLSIGGTEVWSEPIGSSPAKCGSGRIFPRSKLVTYGCGRGESGSRIEMHLEQQSLWLDFIESGYMPTMLVRRVGRQVPCGSRVRFLPFSWRDPKWHPFGSRCAEICGDQSKLCDDGCYRHHADEEGTLSGAGLRCGERCESRRQDCNRRCAARGQYP